MTVTYLLDRNGSNLEATDEQIAIIEAARNTRDNLLINALAGAAKSTTLEFLAKYLPGIPILSLAFNKRIAEELGKRLPGHVNCATLNSIGHRVWLSAIGKRASLDAKKSFGLVKAWIDDQPRAARADYYEIMGDLVRAVDHAKMTGYAPTDRSLLGSREELIEYLENTMFEYGAPDYLGRFIDDILLTSIKGAYDGYIDFNDQIYMPTLFGGTFPRFPLVMVDEAQDLSSLNHHFIRKLVTQRLIAVGDPWQSIYGFRGAVSNGMSALKSAFHMSEYTLSVSFRCPRSVVRLAQARVPHMKYPDWAIEGSVEYLDKWTEKDIPDGSAIICRNNAPLFRCALNLIKAGRGIKLVGADIGPGLLKILKKLGPETLTQEEVHAAIDKWEAAALAKSKAPANTADKAECLRVFADAGPTLSAAVAYAQHLFESAGPIQLMSGHKSKGLEFDNVFHLDPWRVPRKGLEGEALQQELNVLYVITTRAKKRLVHVTLESFR